MRLALVCFYCLCVFVYVLYFIATMSFAGYFLPVLFCMLSMLISDSRFDLVWFRLSCDHGWIRSGSVNVRKQQQQHFSCLEEALQSEFTRVREDYASATSESCTAIGHVSKVENNLLRFSCCCCCCFSHSAYWLPTRKKLLYTMANPARGLLNREKRTK